MTGSQKNVTHIVGYNFVKTLPIFNILLLPERLWNLLQETCNTFHHTLSMLLHQKSSFAKKYKKHKLKIITWLIEMKHYMPYS